MIMAMLLGMFSQYGCHVSRDVSVPKADIPQAYASQQADTINVADLPWNTFFEDPQLRELISRALEHNNDLQIAIKSIDKAALSLRQAKWGNVPTVNLQATATSSRPSDNSLNGLTLGNFLHQSHVEDYTLAATLSWEADLWGKIRSQRSAALASLLQAREIRNAVQTRLVNDIAKGYYNLQMLHEQLKIAEKNVQLNDSTLNMIRLQFEAGQVSSLAMQQAEAQKLDAQQLVPKFEQQITVQENALNILTGAYPGTFGNVASLATTPNGNKLMPGIPAQLLNRRPDVRSAELAISRANAEVGYNKAALYPSLTITAQGGINAFKASNWFQIPSSLFGAVAGGITQPLINHRKLKTDYQIALVNREQVVISFRQSVLNAVGDVSDNLVRIEKFEQQMSLAAKRVSTLEQATTNARLLFNNGMATYLEVITAQANVLQSELTLATIKKSQLDAKVDLYRAVGGGWR